MSLLEMRNVVKRFGATTALAGVTFRAEAGQVLALIGENGAGKSTLMKVLSGAIAADEGEMLLEGRPYRPAGPLRARAAGVAMIYQELNLAPELSVEDNIMLGREQHSAGLLRRGRQKPIIQDALARLGHADLPLATPVGRLSVGRQQLVEIARALAHQARVIVFDEPTSSLTAADVKRLFAVIRRLREQGVCVIYISHFLEEVREICDRYAVLRDGFSVGAGEVSGASDADLVRLMVGRDVDELFPHTPHTPGEVLLDVDGLTADAAFGGVSFQVRRGEVFGLAGLVGAGRTEVLRAVYGLDAVRGGAVRIGGVRPQRGPKGRIAAGAAVVSEDRKSEGLAQDLSINDNVTLSRLAPYSRFGALALGRRRRAVKELIDQFGVKAASSEQPIGQLSGGNQQKAALARLLHQRADLMLLDEPTRGIDVGAKADVYRWIGRWAAEGKAVLFVSSYLPELLAMCDTIGVMSRGRLKEVRPRSAWTEDEVLAVSLGDVES